MPRHSPACWEMVTTATSSQRGMHTQGWKRGREGSPGCEMPLRHTETLGQRQELIRFSAEGSWRQWRGNGLAGRKSGGLGPGPSRRGRSKARRRARSFVTDSLPLLRHARHFHPLARTSMDRSQHVRALGPRAGCLTSPCLSFPVYTTEIVIAPHSWGAED